MNINITQNLYVVDEFCKEFEAAQLGHTLDEDNGKKRCNRKFMLNDGEVIIILLQLKNYINHISTIQIILQTKTSKKIVSYNRFVELQRKVLMSMSILLKTICLSNVLIFL